MQGKHGWSRAGWEVMSFQASFSLRWPGLSSLVTQDLCGWRRWGRVLPPCYRRGRWPRWWRALEEVQVGAFQFAPTCGAGGRLVVFGGPLGCVPTGPNASGVSPFSLFGFSGPYFNWRVLPFWPCSSPLVGEGAESGGLVESPQGLLMPPLSGRQARSVFLSDLSSSGAPVRAVSRGGTRGHGHLLRRVVRGSLEE